MSLDFKLDLSIHEAGKSSPKWSADKDIGGISTLEELTAFTKSALQEIAKTALKEEQDNGFPRKNYLTIVDGKYNGQIQNVSPFGKIQYVSPIALDEAILFIYQGLIERSPVDTGSYRNSHVVTLNGRQVAKNLSQLQAWLKSGPEFGDQDKIHFVNYQHYAGKLERDGNTSQRKKIRMGRGKKKKGVFPKVKKPNGTYWLTHRAAKEKFGRNVFIQFEFRPGSYFGIPRAEKSRHEYVYPSILIYVFKSGIQ